MAWHTVRSILSGKTLFEYDAERRLVRYRHKRGAEEVIDLVRFHCVEDLVETVAAALEEGEQAG